MSSRPLVTASAALVLAFAPAARGEIDVRDLPLDVGPSDPTLLRSHSALLEGDTLSALVELPEGSDPSAYGLPKIGTRWGAARGRRSDLVRLARAHPAWRVTWSPPLRPLMDHAAEWTHAPAFRRATGQTGQGVIVGIVDTGIDFRHPDFRRPDGTTRISYFVDFGRGPVGRHPEAEARCSPPGTVDGVDMEGPHCAVYSAADIDLALAGDPSIELPPDALGHGTHVASLAAGSGGPEAKYGGIAPEASLIVASMGGTDNEFANAAVGLASEVVFFLAERAGQERGLARMPAVVNLSLGTDIGPHDGNSDLERALADLVGPEYPGRAIVVAAGNGAALRRLRSSFPDPLGTHTEVNVPERSSVRVPIVIAPAAHLGQSVNGALAVWIEFQPGDDVRVGLDRRDGPWVPPRPRGTAGEYSDGKALRARVMNNLSNRARSAAQVDLEGSWPASETFAIRLEGRGTARLWVQSGGELGQEGALFPAATKESTVSIPAGHHELIAVGATLNRTEWVDRTGELQVIEVYGSVEDPPLDSIAYFSSAGPTSDGRTKPDLVAPGAFVVGALAREADPRRNPASDLGGASFCARAADCVVVDDGHAVAQGTSMAAPIVSGAVALLFEEDPSLTQDRILALLQAGARRPGGLVPLEAQVGAGALDLEGTRDVLRALTAIDRREPAAAQSWLSLGESFAHPDPDWSLPAILQVRDRSGSIAYGFNDSALDVRVSRGQVTGALERAAPGFYRFSVAADPGTGGETLEVEVSYLDEPLARSTLPIAVDVNVLREGFSARGGCGVAAPGSPRAPASRTSGSAFLVALVVAGAFRRRA